MPLAVPLRVPVEVLREGRGRCFRLAQTVSVDGVELAVAVPAWLADDADDLVTARLFLPEDPLPIAGRARVLEVVVGAAEQERAERLVLRFVQLDEESRARVARYVEERLTAE